MSLVQLVTSDIQQAIEHFGLFHQRFAHYFATKTRNMADTAKQYLQGQLQYQRSGNMVQFEKIVPESDHQSLQHLASYVYSRYGTWSTLVIASNYDNPRNVVFARTPVRLEA